MRNIIGITLIMMRMPVPLCGQPSEPVQAPALWQALYSEDASIFASNLRAAGCPEETAALLVTHEVHRQFAPRFEALQEGLQATGDAATPWNPEKCDAWLELCRERNAHVREALGSMPDFLPGHDWVSRRFRELTPLERDQVRAITEDFDELIALVRADTQRASDEVEVVSFLESQRAAELREFLSENEVVDYQLERSSLGRWIQSYLRGFEPTREELRTYYRTAVELELEADLISGGLERPRAARVAIGQRLRESIPAERFEKLRLCTNPALRGSFYLIRRLGFDWSVTRAVLSDRLAMSQRFERIHEVMHANPEARLSSAEMIRLIEQHCNLVRSLLGDEGYSQYYAINRSWIDGMAAGRMIFTPSEL